ncbi:hypothetical protein B0I35DRAFT_227386 [Stachybotrys elegans]|uniref:Uncharacterized protein n=1 Tax=Stachybotrys elegans TaxID=80388 RepID=A0A8K0WRK6_9HYPO|nr:hypothetical protein B0I35DRAFT_227386 [Stachybotrys elegans]
MADPKPIELTLPSKYAPKTSGPPLPSSAPDLEWMTGTWSVTHSTLAMWRTARNVRITYTLLPAKSDLRPRMDDLVEYEPTGKQGVVKSVQGIDTQADKGWNWKGKGALFFVGSHWEIMGWGDAVTPSGDRERWAVTYFAPTMFTKEGLDIYCDRKEGLSEQTYERIMEALLKLDAEHVVDLVKKEMQPVEITLPWAEK